jgi:hypothetical protein
MRVSLKSSLIGAVILVAITATYLWWVLEMGIPLQVTTREGGVVVDAQKLGEYYSSISTIRLEELQTGVTVWEAVATGARGTSPVWRFVLNNGLNQLPGDLEGFRSTVPGPDVAFEIVPGRDYRVVVWGSSKFSRSSRTFTAPQTALGRKSTHNQPLNLTGAKDAPAG